MNKVYLELHVYVWTTQACCFYRQRCRVLNFPLVIFKKEEMQFIYRQCKMLGKLAWELHFHLYLEPKADPGSAHRPKKKNWDLHAICTICILFIVLTTKTYVMCNGVLKPTPDLKILTRRDRGFQIPLSATGNLFFCIPCVDVCNKNFEKLTWS